MCLVGCGHLRLELVELENAFDPLNPFDSFIITNNGAWRPQFYGGEETGSVDIYGNPTASYADHFDYGESRQIASVISSSGENIAIEGNVFWFLDGLNLPTNTDYSGSVEMEAILDGIDGNTYYYDGEDWDMTQTTFTYIRPKVIYGGRRLRWEDVTFSTNPFFVTLENWPIAGNISWRVTDTDIEGSFTTTTRFDNFTFTHTDDNNEDAKGSRIRFGESGRTNNIITMPPISIGDGPDLKENRVRTCLLYTSPSPRDRTRSRMPSSA